MLTNKKWAVVFLITTIGLLFLLGGIVVIVDPFFHYHAPLSGVEYPINNERYQNDGITKHFVYDAIITGTSMTENFKTSEFDELFGCNSIKIPFSGASFCEESQQLKRALQVNSQVRYVICSLDYYALYHDKDYMRENLPQYLYNDLIWDDVQYVLNKDVLLNQCVNVLFYNYDGYTTTTFDEYVNWTSQFNFGEDAVKATYDHSFQTNDVKQVELSEKSRNELVASINQNFADLADEYPQVEFYLFYPPYSIYFWDERFQEGVQERWLQAQEIVTKLLLERENIHIFSFYDEYELVCNADNYKDTGHYGGWVNSQILYWMRNGEHELTNENYQEYYKRIRHFYSDYDYNALFQIPAN